MARQQLHITNGDSAATTMREAAIPGDVLPWRDALHDGPVPPDLGLSELTPIRARFLSEMADVEFDKILQDMQGRDALLADFQRFDAVTLWLEHDLYDQLQLLQILDWFCEIDLGETRLNMICIDRFPGISPFYGLGQLNRQQMASLRGSERTVTGEQLGLAQRAWQAFSATTPERLVALLETDLSALPFLATALRRHLEEYPDIRTGLSRHERQILEMVKAGTQAAGRLFAKHQTLERAPYLGDWSFWRIIAQLANNPEPLLSCADGRPFLHPPGKVTDAQFRAQRLQLTELGDALLRGELHRAAVAPRHRWLGGVELGPGKTDWRWDNQLLRITAHQG